MISRGPPFNILRLEPGVLKLTVRAERGGGTGRRAISLFGGRPDPTISRLDLSSMRREPLVKDLAPGPWDTWTPPVKGTYALRSKARIADEGEVVDFFDLPSTEPP